MVLAIAAAATPGARQALPATEAFTRFFQAENTQAAAAAAEEIAASGVAFDEAYTRLKEGRSYSREVPRGVVQGSYRAGGSEYFYTLDVPESYDPARKYQVRLQLHGGVGRIEDSRPRDASARGRLAGAEQIYVLPYAWRDAPWWSARQTANLRAILDRVKRTYNVDENRVVVAGVSDGGTGAYFAAMRDTTPFASFLPFNGFLMVLRNEMAEADGDVFPNNLLNKPMFVVNGGRDPQYPTSMVDPYIDHLRKGGVDITYRPQPNAAHDTSWWPELRDEVEQFVASHPRQPLPDVLTWQTGSVPARAHWVVIDRLAPRQAGEAPLADLNSRRTTAVPDFGIHASGSRINSVGKGSNAQQLGLRGGDVIAAINGQPISIGTDVAEVLRNFPVGRPLILTVERGVESVRLTGRFAPTVLPGEADSMFPPQSDSGRVDLARKGNRIEASASGVAAFTLLLSPEQFDFDQPLTVVVNGRTLFEGGIQKDLRTLLKWAAQDNDRTLLFGAELRVEVVN